MSGGIHILAILGKSKTTSGISTLLGAVGYRVNTESSAGQVIDTMAAHGGRAIPAHADKRAGLFEEASGNDLKAITENKNVVAIEVIARMYTMPPLYLASKKGWAEILGSDSHHKELR